MQYSFSDRISNLHPSAIREILKNSDPNVISLAAGNPALNLSGSRDEGNCRPYF